MKDYYKILEIERNSTSDEIKKVYRDLAKKWHPDACKLPNAHEKFVEISEGYEILIDPIKRKEYDELWSYYQDTQQTNYRTNNSQGNNYNYSNTEYRYTGREQENYYKEKEQSFNANQTEARRRAQTYYSMSLDDLLVKVLGMVIDSTVKVAKYTVFGQEDVKLTFGERLVIGGQVLLFILMVVLTFTGILAPIGAPLGMLLFKAMMKKGKFIGIGKMVTSTLMLAGLLLLGIMIIDFIGGTNNNNSYSYTYNDSTTYEDNTYDKWENSLDINNDYNGDNYYNESISSSNYVKPTKIPEEKLMLIVEAFVAIGRAAHGYEYSHTEIGEVIMVGGTLYQEYNVIQVDKIENRGNKVWTLYEDVNSRELFVPDGDVLDSLDTIISYRECISDESVKWVGKQYQDGQYYMCFDEIGNHNTERYAVNILTLDVDIIGYNEDIDRSDQEEPQEQRVDELLEEEIFRVLQEYVEPYEDAIFGEYHFEGIEYINQEPYYRVLYNPNPFYGSTSIAIHYYVDIDLKTAHEWSGEEIEKVEKLPYEEYLKAIEREEAKDAYYNSRERIEGNSPYVWQERRDPLPVYENQQYLINEAQAMEIAEFVWMVKSPTYRGVTIIEGTMFHEFEYDTRRWTEWIRIDVETGIPYDNNSGIYIKTNTRNISN